MTLPQTPPVSDDEIVRSLTSITYAFCGALLMVLFAGVFFIVPEPTVTPAGLLIGAALGLVSWFLPTLVIRKRLAQLAQHEVAPEAAPALVRAVVMIGIALAEFPALLGFAATFAMPGGHDIGPFVLSIPLAVASLWFNVSGPGAVRRHLERVRSTVAF